MKESYLDYFPADQLHTISRQSRTQLPRSRDECPLCCYKIQENKESALPGNYHSKKRPKEPLGKMNTKSARTSVEMDHPEPYDSTEGGSCGSHGQVGQYDVNNQPSPEFAKNIARHIAAHLHVLMLLTIRLTSLHNETETPTHDIESDIVDVDNYDIDIDQAAEPGAMEDIPLHKDGEIKQANKEEVTVPPLESDIDWNIVPRGDERLVGKDEFLLGVIRSGAFQSHLGNLDAAQQLVSSAQAGRESLAQYGIGPGIKVSGSPPNNQGSPTPSQLTDTRSNGQPDGSSPKAQKDTSFLGHSCR